ncbi:flagellar basal body-associated FliL family protein [Thioclava sp. FR2]|uniref:flagellar basal body-associated FliL family protein n=1 Tax=Thioclava sp. FR2 TaxID=3445780 RepID=UPI003EBF0426
MKKALLPVSLLALGLSAGAGAGLFLRPEAAMPQGEDASQAAVPAPVSQKEAGETLVPEFVKLPNQFVVPIVDESQVVSLMVLSLSIEVEAGETSRVFAYEPKLRDGFLRMLFDFANSGGFSGEFTETATLDVLRQGLLNVAQGILGQSVTDVLITDLIRQDS